MNKHREHFSQNHQIFGRKNILIRIIKRHGSVSRQVRVARDGPCIFTRD